MVTVKLAQWAANVKIADLPGSVLNKEEDVYPAWQIRV
jgi:hypothetical protein